MLVLAVLWVVRYAMFIGLYRGTGTQHRTALRNSEWVLWAAWMAGFLVGAVLLFAENTAGFYVLAGCVASGMLLIVWNAWVLLAEVSG